MVSHIGYEAYVPIASVLIRQSHIENYWLWNLPVRNGVRRRGILAFVRSLADEGLDQSSLAIRAAPPGLLSIERATLVRSAPPAVAKRCAACAEGSWTTVGRT